MNENSFFHKPQKTKIDRNDVLMETLAIHDPTCGNTLPKDLWLEIMSYLPESDLIALMLTCHMLRLNAINSLKLRVQPPLRTGGFFNTRYALYRNLLRK